MLIDKNKKGEGTSSTFLIASIIGISILVVIGTYVNYFAGLYSTNSVDYFANYEDIMGNITVVGEDFVGDYDYDQNSTNTDIDRTEDSLFFKAFNIIRKLPRVLGGVGSGLFQLSTDLGIPTPFVVLLSLCLGILLIALVIQVIRGFRNV